MFNGPTFYTSDELAQRARRSQEVARSRDARSSDNFLVSAPNSTVSETDPVAAYPIPEREMANSCGTYAGSCRAGYQEGLHESLIRKTLELQSPDGAAKFKLTMCGADSSVSLPGGAPIVDHLLVRAEVERDWACLMPGLEYIRQHRSPSLDVDTHNLELTLGSSESNAFKTALIFLRKRTKDILETYHVCQLSGDTEAIGINPDIQSCPCLLGPTTRSSWRNKERLPTTSLPGSSLAMWGGRSQSVFPFAMVTTGLGTSPPELYSPSSGNSCKRSTHWWESVSPKIFASLLTSSRASMGPRALFQPRLSFRLSFDSPVSTFPATLFRTWPGFSLAPPRQGRVFCRRRKVE
jgi:hypothetical protein